MKKYSNPKKDVYHDSQITSAGWHFLRIADIYIYIYIYKYIDIDTYNIYIYIYKYI